MCGTAQGIDTVETAPDKPFVLQMPVGERLEFMIGPSGDPAAADLHLLYTGDEQVSGNILTGGDVLAPTTFAMRYGDGWVEIGQKAAGAAYGNTFVLRNALPNAGLIRWTFDHGLAVGESARLWTRASQGWNHALTLSCVEKKTRPPVTPPPQDPPQKKQVEKKQAATPPDDVLRFTGVTKEDGTLILELVGPRMAQGTVLFGDLVAEDGVVTRTVPVLIGSDHSATLRFSEPFLGWAPGRYTIRVRTEETLLREGSVTLP